MIWKPPGIDVVWMNASSRSACVWPLSSESDNVRLPMNISITELGSVRLWFTGNCSKSCTVMPRVSRKIAMSPTTLLDGVTFTMSPNAIFTSAPALTRASIIAPSPQFAASLSAVMS